MMICNNTSKPTTTLHPERLETRSCNHTRSGWGLRRMSATSASIPPPTGSCPSPSSSPRPPRCWARGRHRPLPLSINWVICSDGGLHGVVHSVRVIVVPVVHVGGASKALGRSNLAVGTARLVLHSAQSLEALALSVALSLEHDAALLEYPVREVVHAWVPHLVVRVVRQHFLAAQICTNTYEREREREILSERLVGV